MNIRPIGNNEISFLMKRKVPKKQEKTENNTNMVYEPNNDSLFPKKWMSVIIITKSNEGDEDGEETEGLDRK